MSVDLLRAQEVAQSLRLRAKIRRQIPTRKSVQNGETDRLADQLDIAADVIEDLVAIVGGDRFNAGHL